MTLFDVLTLAKKLNHYAADATGGGLWTDTTHYRVTVPAGKRWFFLTMTVARDVSATAVVFFYDVNDKIWHQLAESGAATGTIVLPNTVSSTHQALQSGFPIVLEAGEYVEVLLGVAQGAGAHCSFTVLEIDV